MLLMQTFSSRSLFAVVALACAPLPVGAQLCAGAQSFDVHPIRVTGLAILGDAANGFGGGFTIGRTRADERGAFVGIHAARMGAEEESDLEEFGFSSSPAYTGELEVGWQLPLGGRPVSMCPSAGVSYTDGPTITMADPFGGPGAWSIKGRVWGFTGGMWMGGVLRSETQFRVIPAAGLHLAHARATVTAEGGGPDFPSEDDGGQQSETFAIMSLAAGFAFDRNWLVRPRVSIPIGLDGAGPSLFLGLSYNFGGRL